MKILEVKSILWHAELLRHGFESVKHLVIAVMFQVIMGPVMKIIINLNFFNDVYRERELPLDMTYSYYTYFGKGS